MIESADVFKNRIRAGKLTRAGGGTRFAYEADYLASALPPVASTLPVTAEPMLTASGAVPSFFAGLLPEGRRLTTLRRAIKASADDELSLLVEIGGDTVGDVQIVPSGDPVPIVEPALELPPSLSEIRFATLLAETAPVDRVGIPGVQDKVSGKMIAVPAMRASRRYILKLNPPEYPHVVENEAFFIGLAKACRMPTVRARIVHDADHTPGLLVERFDRLAHPSGIATLLAVEDACQALDRWPADKYATTMEAVTAALATLTTARAVAARDAFRQFTFALLTGNGDLHAKNVSVLADESGEFRISPAYDLPSTVFYGDTTLALPVQGKRSGVSRRILLDFAEDVGLRRPAAERVLDDLLRGTSSLTDALDNGALPFGRAATTKAVKQLEYRRRLLEGRS